MREKWQSWCSAGPTDFGSSLRPQIADHPPVTRTPSFSGSELIRSPQQVVSGFNFFFLCTSETFNGFYGAQEALISQASPTCAYVVPIHQVGTIANSFIREYKKNTGSRKMPFLRSLSENGWTCTEQQLAATCRHISSNHKPDYGKFPHFKKRVSK